MLHEIARKRKIETAANQINNLLNVKEQLLAKGAKHDAELFLDCQICSLNDEIDALHDGTTKLNTIENNYHRLADERLRRR